MRAFVVAVLGSLVACGGDERGQPVDGAALDAAGNRDSSSSVAPDQGTPDSTSDLGADERLDLGADGTLDAGATPSIDGGDDGGPAADLGAPPGRDGGPVPTDAGGATTVELLRVDGCFLEVRTPGERTSYDVGVRGTRYASITIAFDVTHGGWREELFDRESLAHNLFGFSRNAPVSRERYILGEGALVRPAAAGLQRTSLFYARVDLEERPAGMGFMGYTSFRDAFPWTPGETYHLQVVLDAISRTQTLDISVGGETRLRRAGDIAYFDVSLTDSGWSLEIGSEESDGRDVSPVGWRYCDLAVTALPM
ncbi:MAG: hypothetical protein IT379_39855 [Deltaproteobacteria bacterium]|nr:hypothetical protein [Deltaproteobacteria bacterium]